MEQLNPFIESFPQIFGAFTKDISIWWLLAPLIILWLVMELYFAEYKHERLGFSSILANGTSLLWVVIVSLRIFFLLNGDFHRAPEFWAIAFFGVYAIFLIYISFTHFISEKVVDYFADPSVVYFFSVVALLWGHEVLDFNLYIVADLLVLMVFVNLFFFVLKHFFFGIRGDVELVKHAGEKEVELNKK